MVVVAAILGSYVLQSLVGAGPELGFAPADLDHGHWSSLITMMFVHGGWLHAITNALAAFAFGPPVARLLGGGVRGAAVFFGFYLVCGVLANLGYAALHLQPRRGWASPRSGRAERRK